MLAPHARDALNVWRISHDKIVPASVPTARTTSAVFTRLLL
jgi:hypothetical protein